MVVTVGSLRKQRTICLFVSLTIQITLPLSKAQPHDMHFSTISLHSKAKKKSIQKLGWFLKTDHLIMANKGIAEEHKVKVLQNHLN